MDIGSLDNFDPERDSLSIQWYHRPPGFTWAGCRGVGAISASHFGAVQRARLLPREDRAAPVSRAGDYRAEVYLNARLAGQAETTAEFGAMKAAGERDLNTLFCTPPDWTRSEVSKPGLFVAYLSPGGDKGSLLFRFNRGSRPRRRRRGAPRSLTS